MRGDFCASKPEIVEAIAVALKTYLQFRIRLQQQANSLLDSMSFGYVGPTIFRLTHQSIGVNEPSPPAQSFHRTPGEFAARDPRTNGPHVNPEHTRRSRNGRRWATDLRGIEFGSST
ncbi:hypothetical protein [Mycobacteroides abscessus]|uniref:hypothetical protein n=1 Tax=Mycobacteroides abscessus TaxID=36809 RepID=UPI00030D0B89|nr:hypothetical protein [Mycobacteroides abscessus]MDO2969898.1 hypothetical protein [Mycobacteroides abscessus subsp. bolletii]MDO3079900.1 hypothetical protein [Mycobacteroides abscessus subsp. bolletii]